MPIFVAPYTETYTSRTPYLTPAEYTNAPTGVDVSQLVPAGSGAAETAELTNVIARASSWVDQLCYQVLAATTTVDNAYVRVRADGTVRVVCKYWPVLELDTFSAGSSPSTITPITDTLDVWVDGKSVLVVPVAGTTVPYAGQQLASPVRAGDRVYVQWSYVSGWPNTLLTSASVVGATTLAVGSALGVYAGTILTVFDGQFTEQITVASVTGTTLTLAAPTQFAHNPGVSVSNLPPAVKQATISLTSALIKTRGAESMVMGAIGAEPTHTALADGGGLEDVAVAVDLLTAFKRVV